MIQLQLSKIATSSILINIRIRYYVSFFPSCFCSYHV